MQSLVQGTSYVVQDSGGLITRNGVLYKGIFT